MKTLESFLKTSGFSQSTQRTYRYMLMKAVAEAGDPTEWDAVALADWLDTHSWGDNTRYVAATVVKAFCRYMDGHDHPVLSFRVRKPETEPGRSLTETQVKRLYEIFITMGDGQRALKDRRDVAMVSVLLDTGLRSHEIVGMKLHHVRLDDLMYPHLLVKIKGGRWDEKPFSEHTATDLLAWLAVREQIVRTGETAVFVGVGGNTPGKAMTTDGFRAVVRGWARRAGIAKLSPHDFRRTSATLAAEQGASDQVLMEHYGWRDARMPRRYTRRLRKQKFLDYSPVARMRR